MPPSNQLDADHANDLSTPHLPLPDFIVNELLPQSHILAPLKYSTQATLSLINNSHRPVLFQLAGQSGIGGCYVEFKLPTGRVSWAEFEVGPGQAITVSAQITVPPPPLLALKRRKHYFAFTATILAQRSLYRSRTGWVETTPLIGPRLMTLAAFGLLVLTAFWLPGLWPAPAVVTSKNDASTPTSRPDWWTTPVFQAGNSPSAGLEDSAPPTMTYQQMFEQVAEQYGLDWQLLAEIAYQESRFNPWAIGRHNEMGLMQIHPNTWAEWSAQVGVIDPYDPYSNVQVAAAYLVYLKDFCRTRGYNEQHWMLVGYNWGPDNLRQIFDRQGGWGEIPAKQQQYAIRIMEYSLDTSIRRQEKLQTPLSLTSK
ncbi:MAG: transglycosylase SLT domain-containing protein [Anaerolineales bacterium]|nr:transglycosylase SLT domain-containing protein [Anaerolineales bacterium]